MRRACAERFVHCYACSIVMMAAEELRVEEKYVLKKKVRGLADGEQRGYGAYGIVRTVSVNGTTCIAKRIHDILQDPRVPPADRESVKLKFMKECKMLSELRHPNIVHFVGVHYDKRGYVSLVMEVLDSDLRGFFQRSEPDLPVKLGILRDVSYGLLHLHSRQPPIIHRDLNPGNILLTRTLQAKIADLGVSSYLTPSKMQTMAPGAWDYMPPEALLENPRYDTSLDIFSFGHVTLCVGTHSVVNIPIPSANPGGIRAWGHLFIKRRREYLNSIGQKHCLHSLAVECLHDSPHKRPSARDLCDKLQWLCTANRPCDDATSEKRRESAAISSQNETTEDTHTGSNSNPTHFPSSKDSQDFSTFMSSNEDEQDSSLAVGKAGEPDGTEHETVSLLKKRIAELTAEKEELKEIAEAQKAQAQVYKTDFDIERSDRVKAHNTIGDYKFQLEKLQRKFAELEEIRMHTQAELHVFKAANALLLKSHLGPLPAINHPHPGNPPVIPPKSQNTCGEGLPGYQPRLPVQHVPGRADCPTDKPHHHYEKIPL